jgi:hypothetical protein
MNRTLSSMLVGAALVLSVGWAVSTAYTDWQLSGAVVAGLPYRDQHGARLASGLMAFVPLGFAALSWRSLAAGARRWAVSYAFASFVIIGMFLGLMRAAKYAVLSSNP